MIELTFVGTGEACDPEAPNTSLLYRGSKILLLDCGYSVPQAFWRITRDSSLVDAVFLSHRHADHVFGLPALLLWMHETGRTKPLTVFGSLGLADWLDRLFELAYPGLLSKGGAFDLVPVELTPGTPHDLGPLTLRTAASTHSVVNAALRIEEAGRVVCYSGDGAPTDSTRDLFRGADVLVHECYGATLVSAYHADADTLLPMADELGIRTLCLLHMARHQRHAIRNAVEKHHGRVALCTPEPGETLNVN